MNPTALISFDFVTSLHSTLSQVDSSVLPLPVPSSPSLPDFIITSCLRLITVLDPKQDPSTKDKLIRSLQQQRQRLEDENDELHDELERLQREKEDIEEENGEQLTRLLMVNVLKKTLENKEIMYQEKEKEWSESVFCKNQEIERLTSQLNRENERKKPEVKEIQVQTETKETKNEEMQSEGGALLEKGSQIEVFCREIETQIEEIVGKSEKNTQIDAEFGEIMKLFRIKSVQTESEPTKTDFAVQFQSESFPKTTQTDQISPKNTEKSIQTEEIPRKFDLQTIETQTEIHLNSANVEIQTYIDMKEESSETILVLNSTETQVNPETKEMSVQSRVRLGEIEGRVSEVEVVGERKEGGREVWVQTDRNEVETQWIQTETTEEKEAEMQVLEEELQCEDLLTSCSQCTQTAVSFFNRCDIATLAIPQVVSLATSTELHMKTSSVQTQLLNETRTTQTHTVTTQDATIQANIRGKDDLIYSPKPVVYSKASTPQSSHISFKQLPKTTKNSTSQTPVSEAVKSQMPASWKLMEGMMPWPTSTSLPVTPKDPESLLSQLQSPRRPDDFLIRPQPLPTQTAGFDLLSWETQLQAKESSLLSLSQQLKQRERMTLEKEQRERRRKLYEAGAVTQLYPTVPKTG